MHIALVFNEQLLSDRLEDFQVIRKYDRDK